MARQCGHTYATHLLKYIYGMLITHKKRGVVVANLARVLRPWERDWQRWSNSIDVVQNTFNDRRFCTRPVCALGWLYQQSQRWYCAVDWLYFLYKRLTIAVLDWENEWFRGFEFLLVGFIRLFPPQKAFYNNIVDLFETDPGDRYVGVVVNVRDKILHFFLA